MSAVTMPKSNFSVSSLLNSSNTNTNTNNNTNVAANVTANYLNFLNKFRPIGFPTPMSTSRGLLAPPPPLPPTHPPESIHRTQDDGVHDDPKAELEGKDLWDQFHQHGTEMVCFKKIIIFIEDKKNKVHVFFFFLGNHKKWKVCRIYQISLL
jgi:hypothetical protein